MPELAYPADNYSDRTDGGVLGCMAYLPVSGVAFYRCGTGLIDTRAQIYTSLGCYFPPWIRFSSLHKDQHEFQFDQESDPPVHYC
jgi:hypothetical protein